MVSPAPNLTVLSGIVLARRPHDSLADWDAVSLAVDSVSPVPGMRDLVGPSLARANRGARARDGRPEVVVAVRRELLGDAGTGWRLTSRVKLSPNGPMAEAHPTAGHFTVEPPQGR